MGIIYVRSANFEVRLEEEHLFQNRAGGGENEYELKPHIAELFDNLTDKFAKDNTLKSKKLKRARNPENPEDRDD